MKGFVELTWLTFAYPVKPAPDVDSTDWYSWVHDPHDKTVEPEVSRLVSTIDVRDILEFGGPDVDGRPEIGCRIVRHSQKDDQVEPYAVEESYEEVKRRITEATIP